MLPGRGAQGDWHRPLSREQAFGESLEPDKLERLRRYEVHLDRKLERTLSMSWASRTCGPRQSRADELPETNGGATRASRRFPGRAARAVH